MKILKVNPKSQEIERICGREVAPSKEIHDKVMDILADIKNGGYAKAVEYAQKFDGLKARTSACPKLKSRSLLPSARPKCSVP